MAETNMKCRNFIDTSFPKKYLVVSCVVSLLSAAITSVYKHCFFGKFALLSAHYNNHVDLHTLSSPIVVGTEQLNIFKISVTIFFSYILLTLTMEQM